MTERGYKQDDDQDTKSGHKPRFLAHHFFKSFIGGFLHFF